MLIVIVIVAHKTYVYKRQASWSASHNGYHCEGRKMEPFLLDNEEDLNTEATSMDSFQYPKRDTKDNLALSNF